MKSILLTSSTLFLSLTLFAQERIFEKLKPSPILKTTISGVYQST